MLSLQMKFPAIIFLWIIGFSLLSFTLGLTSSETKIVQHTEVEDPQKEGFWNPNVAWKSRWVKYWHQKTIYVPVWKKVYSPVVQNEWIPLPNAPPGWTNPNEQYEIQEIKY